MVLVHYCKVVAALSRLHYSFRMQGPERHLPKIGVGVFVRRDGRVLLLRRKGSHGAGTWSLPGGYLEWGERLEECAAREVLEETGLVAGAVRFLGITNDVMTAEAKHYVTIFMEADCEGEPYNCEPEKADELGWFELDALPQPLFLPMAHFVAGEAYISNVG